MDLRPERWYQQVFDYFYGKSNLLVVNVEKDVAVAKRLSDFLGISAKVNFPTENIAKRRKPEHLCEIDAFLKRFVHVDSWDSDAYCRVDESRRRKRNDVNPAKNRTFGALVHDIVRYDFVMILWKRVACLYLWPNDSCETRREARQVEGDPFEFRRASTALIPTRWLGWFGL